MLTGRAAGPVLIVARSAQRVARLRVQGLAAVLTAVLSGTPGGRRWAAGATDARIHGCTDTRIHGYTDTRMLGYTLASNADRTDDHTSGVTDEFDLLRAIDIEIDQNLIYFDRNWYTSTEIDALHRWHADAT